MAILTDISSFFTTELSEKVVAPSTILHHKTNIFDFHTTLSICITIFFCMCVAGLTLYFCLQLHNKHIEKMREVEDNRLNKDNEGDKLSEEDVNKLVNDRINELKEQEAKSEKRRDEEIKAINEICQKALALKNVGLDVDITFNEGPNQIRISSRKEHKTEENSK